MALPSGPRPDSQGELASRLRDIEALADAALSRLDEQALLETLCRSGAPRQCGQRHRPHQGRDQRQDNVRTARPR